MGGLTRRRALLGAAGEPLPAAYREVEYVAVNGAAAVNCEIPFNQATDSLTISLMVLGKTSDWAWAFGAVNSASNGNCGVQIPPSNTALNLFGGASTSVTAYLQNALGQRCTVTLDANGCTVNGYRHTSYASNVFDRFVLFSWYRSGERKANMRIYSVTINDDSLIPCYRRSDGEAGFYDEKRGLFLGKSEGWGDASLIAGPEV